MPFLYPVLYVSIFKACWKGIKIMTIKFIYIQYIYIYNLYIFVNNPQGHRKGWDLRGGGHDLLYFLALIFCQFKLLIAGNCTQKEENAILEKIYFRHTVWGVMLMEPPYKVASKAVTVVPHPLMISLMLHAPCNITVSPIEHCHIGSLSDH